MRRFLTANALPPEDAVRIEELINYFRYQYPMPEGPHPFSITVDGAVCPWNTAHQLVRIGLQGKVHDREGLPPSNLVFLIDVSGSMEEPNKLPLVQSSLQYMVKQLTANERVAIVVYAGAAGEVLESTPGNQQQRILSAIGQLQAGGSTAGGEGIALAYEIARKHFIKDGNNRVILATDGDFNVGVSSDAELIHLIERERESGIFLTVLGFGTGNYQDAKMQKLGDAGNGQHFYIDTAQEARKVLGHELGSTLFTIAKDVKIQIEFNPAKVKAYRLIGYENRLLAKEDFIDDTKDAGELGAGHTVTALYELVPAKAQETFGEVDALVYQRTEPIPSDEVMTVKMRYKDPDGTVSRLITQTIASAEFTEIPDGDFAFAAAVAEFGLLLRRSPWKANASYAHVLTQTTASQGEDRFGYRAEFLELVKQAQQLDDLAQTPDGVGIRFKGDESP